MFAVLSALCVWRRWVGWMKGRDTGEKNMRKAEWDRLRQRRGNCKKVVNMLRTRLGIETVGRDLGCT